MIDTHPLLAREGWMYLALAVIATFVAYALLGGIVAVVFLLITLFVLQFFRDPHRAIPQDDDVVVSPADGKVIFVGEVKKVEYFAGQFVNAALDKASEANERNAIVLEDEKGRDIVSIQVAGLVARRILCYVKASDELDRGQRYGFIRFGSRVDLFLPLEFEPSVSIGDNVSSGKDILGKFS